MYNILPANSTRPTFKANMLICTNLIFELHQISKLVGNWNLLPFQYPYQIYVNKNDEKYNFTVNPNFLKTDWMYQILIFSLATFLGTYKACFEISSIFNRFVTLFFVFFAALFLHSTCFHKKEANDFCSFMNRLILFEARIFDNFSPKDSHYRHECLYWKSNKTRLLVFRASRLLAVAAKTHCIFHGLSCAIVPSVSWNLVPLSLIYIVTINIDDYFVQVSFVIVKHVAVGLYIYVTLRVYANYFTINMLINMFIPTFCLSTSLKVLQRKLAFSKT